MDAFVKFFSLHRPFEAYFYEICFGRRPLREERWTRLATWWLPAIRPPPLQIRMNARKKKSLLTSDGCWSLKCCLFSPLHLSFIPSGISEKIDLEMMSLTFLIWSGPNSATKRIRRPCRPFQIYHTVQQLAVSVHCGSKPSQALTL